MIGTTVQITSMAVLWVVLFEGVGFDLALKRTMTMTRSVSTSRVMSTAVHSRMPLWNEWIESMIVVTDGWRPIWPGTGWPGSCVTAGAASCARAAAGRTAVTAAIPKVRSVFPITY